MTNLIDQLDPEILAPLVERVCVRACRMLRTDLGDRRITAPLVLVGERLTLADCPSETAAAVLLKLAEGHRCGFFVVRFDEGISIFGWFVRDADTEPLVQVSALEITSVGAVGVGDDLGGN